MAQERIAVIGLSYRAPGVHGKSLWDYLSQARSAWTSVPSDRFDQSAYYQAGGQKSGAIGTKGAHFIDKPFGFDAAFFNMRADEAKHADPQHRLMLEVALEAAEDAGKTFLDLAGKKIGVFVGSGQHEYAQRLGDDEHSIQTFSGTGAAPCMAANRVSYFFDIDGPSCVADAACASSVYAADMAVRALRNGECDGAFVGSASLNLSPAGWLVLEKTGALSEHGRSYSYDTKASGFGRGEGAACLLLKRYDDAIRDGDPVQALILSSACNHSGRSDGITMPNGLAQQKLLWAVHNAAGVDPSETPVVEGHGTGTAVGDPIEAGAFTAVLARNRTADNPIYLGSLKSNFGHLEGASGVLAMVKAIMMVKKGIVLPTAGFEKINPKIEGHEKIKIAEMPLPWPENEPRRCIVTNFGFGGSNSAILIEAAPTKTVANEHSMNGANGTNGHALNGTNGTNGTNGYAMNAANGTNGHTTNGTNGVSEHHENGYGVISQTHRLYTFSAKTQKSLTAYLSSFDEYLDTVPETSEFAKNLSYTLGQRRNQYSYRAAAVADSIESLQEKLTDLKPTRTKERAVLFAFTGQGAQYSGMASELGQFEVFAKTLQEAELQLRSMGAPWSLTEELQKPSSESRVDDAEISQPACTAVQLALVMLLKYWGVTPAAVIGHSSGEIAASFAAGLITFQQAIAASYFRGQAAAQLARKQQQQGEKGAMLALGVSAKEASRLIEKHAEAYATVAAVNSPNSVTISGDQSAIDNVHKAAEDLGLFVRKLKVQMAYHSRHMEAIAASYLEAIKPYFSEGAPYLSKESSANPVFVSSVTGRVLDRIESSYWVKNLVQPVMFLDAVQGLLAPEHLGKTKAVQALPRIVIEVGPHAALKNPIKQTAELVQIQQNWTPASFTYLPTLLRGTKAAEAMLELASALFTLGARVELKAVNQTDKLNAEVVTELPAYAWDRTDYELRPRGTHDKYFPGEDLHPLLGRKISSQGSQERAYRQVFTLDEMPWIRDHVVGGATIFPMTGYMSCAIEAARRTLSTPAAAFLVTDFHVSRSLEIHEEETIDMTTKLRPAAIGEGAFSTKAWSFEITTWAEESGWTKHSWGQIEAEMTEMSMDTPTFRASLPLVNTTAGLKEHDINAEYETAGLRATLYGPSFRNNVKFYEGKGYTVLEHRLRDLGKALTDPYARGSPVSTDPPTLDGFLQGGGPLQYDEHGRRPAQMPNYISRFRVSNKIPSDPSHRFDVVMRRLDYDIRGGRMHVGVAAFARGPNDELTPIAEWESCAFRNIGSAEEVIDPSATVPDNWSWEVLPRYDFVPQEQLRKKLCDAVGELGVEEDIRIRKGEEAACYYIEKALKETTDLDYSKLPHHLARFVHWGFKTVAEYNLDFSNEPTELLNEVRTSDAQGELICIMGEHIVDILRGKIEPLELMLTDGRLTRHYEADVTNAHQSKVLGYLAQYLADLEPNQRILEIGGGTAGTTLPVVEGLSRGRDELGVLDYTFTDISSGFFEMARKKLGNWSQRIIYKRLDITQDPSEQGFEQQDYDVVIAANVLHATADMVKTMTHVRSLLKPGGKLILLEAMRHPASVLPFSLLPGWWEAEDKYRDHEAGPMMPATVWNQLLLDTGFSGVDVVLPSRYGTDKPFVSIMGSTRVGKQDESRPITICGPFLDDNEVEFAQSVADLISKELGYPTEMKPYAEIDSEDRPYYIFIDSPNKSALQDMDQDKFKSLQTLLLQNTGLLWVTPEGASPDAKIIQGMVRTLRMEVDLKNLILFEDVPCTTEGAKGILKLASKLRDPELSRDQDFDFAWHDGAIQLPRMRQLKEVKEQFAVEEGVAFRKTQNLWDDSGRGLEMTIDAAGSPDTIYFQRTDISQLGEDEVVVSVEAAGVGYRDLEVILGSIPWAPPSFEGAGKIVKTGSRITHLREGDNVFFLSPNSSALATEVKLPSWLVGKIPEGLSVTDAATLPLAYSLAVLALFQTARLRKGETVLIHAAAGAVGQACVVLAQNVGAHVYVTAGNEAKRNLLHEQFGIPKERIFSSRTPKFRDEILSATGNKGIDVIVNSLGGELMTETWALAAPFGRFVEIGKKDAFQNNSLPMRPFNRNVTYTGIDLRDLYQYRRDDIKDVFTEVVTLLQRGNIQPIRPVNTTPVSQFASALRKLKSGDHMGKMVITLGKNDTVVAETPLRPLNITLKPDATYLVAGGTRGIGLDLAYWMIDHGARYIVLLGRSGASGPEAQKILNRYEGTDICVKIFSCNVGYKEELAEVVEAIRDLPPVRGVVHSALLLSDKLFVNATLEDWEIICTPRVKGAWNLHELMPNDLDFFVALSSFNGDTGNLGQAIYAGTAGFYNAFSQYRNSLGQYTVSVALPVVLDVGYVADNNLSEILKESLGVAITMADIRAIFGGILLGPDSPFVYNGRAQTFMVYIDGQPVQNGGWKYFHPVHTKVRLMSDRRNRVKAASGGADAHSASWTTAEDLLIGLTEAIITKVSAMTMIEREEVLPDAPLTSYNLDSLVSVELRNWIRRETAVELTLSAIMQADSLRALAAEILAQRKVD